MLFERLLFGSHLAEDERIVASVHRHLFALIVLAYKTAFLGILVPVVLYLAAPDMYPLWLLWGGIGLVQFFYQVAKWYFDALIVTTHGIIDLDWRGFFSKSIYRIEFESFAGVHIEKEGVWANLLNFGTVTVTQGEDSSEHLVQLHYAAEPEKIKDMIAEAKEAFEEESGAGEEEAIKNILTRMIRQEMQRQREEEDVL